MNKSPEQNRQDVLNGYLNDIRKISTSFYSGYRKFYDRQIKVIYCNYYSQVLKHYIVIFYDEYGWGWSDTGTFFRKFKKSEFSHEELLNDRVKRINYRPVYIYDFSNFTVIVHTSV